MTLHDTSTFNIEPTLNAFFAREIGLYDKPVWLPTFVFVYNTPEIEANLPCYSFDHLSGSVEDSYMGRVENDSTSVMKAYGILEVNAWVNRNQNYNGQNVWHARLRWMASVVEEIVNKNARVPLMDYLSDPLYPADTGYLVTLERMQIVQTAQNPNPAVERKRLLIPYCWGLRASVS